jgi:hypothetical protein
MDSGISARPSLILVSKRLSRSKCASRALSYLEYYACPLILNTCSSYEDVLWDFSTLTPGVPLTNIDQAIKLHSTCSMSVTATGTRPGKVYANPPINVFDSLNGVLSKYRRDDPDLGAPNRACGPILVGGKVGPGRGVGGKPFLKVLDENTGQTIKVDNLYKNCNPLGNLLIIQNGGISVEEKANDSPFGGCMEFEFDSLHGVKLTDCRLSIFHCTERVFKLVHLLSAPSLAIMVIGLPAARTRMEVMMICYPLQSLIPCTFAPIILEQLHSSTLYFAKKTCNGTVAANDGSRVEKEKYYMIGHFLT